MKRIVANFREFFMESDGLEMICVGKCPGFDERDLIWDLVVGFGFPGSIGDK